MLALFIVLTVVFASVAGFLGSEFLKKFRFMRDFISNSNQMVVWHYRGLEGRKPGMRNIVLRGSKPFCALVGFKLDIPILGYSGFDYYGFVRSDDQGIAVISTYLGKGECEFQFFVNTDLDHSPVSATSSEDDQRLQPHSTYPPHWYQRLSFYG